MHSSWSVVECALSLASPFFFNFFFFSTANAGVTGALGQSHFDDNAYPRRRPSAILLLCRCYIGSYPALGQPHRSAMAIVAKQARPTMYRSVLASTLSIALSVAGDRRRNANLI